MNDMEPQVLRLGEKGFVMASKMPDQPAWVNALGVCVLIAGFAGVTLLMVAILTAVA